MFSEDEDDDVKFEEYIPRPINENSLEEARRRYTDITINDQWVIETNKYNKDVEDVINTLKKGYFMQKVKYKYFNHQKMIAIGGKVHVMEIYRNGVYITNSLDELIQYIQNDIIKAIETEIAETYLVLPEVKKEKQQPLQYKYHTTEQSIFIHSALEYLSKRYAGSLCVIKNEIIIDILFYSNMATMLYDTHTDSIRVFDNFWPSLNDCLLNNSARFIAIYLVINCMNKLGHANILLYDKYLRTMERFEPNGTVMKICSTPIMDANILKFLNDGYTQPIIDTYYTPVDFCPFLSFQAIQAKEIPLDIAKKLKEDPDGFCSYWSIWYVELRLSNQEKDIAQLQKETIKLLTEKRIFGKDSFTDFIRRYASFLHSYHKTSVDDIGSVDYSADYEHGYTKIGNIIDYDVYRLKDINK